MAYKCGMAKPQDFNERLREEAKPRAERAARLRAAGETWAVIGQVLGVTRQRAQALVKRYETRDKSAA